MKSGKVRQDGFCAIYVTFIYSILLLFVGTVAELLVRAYVRYNSVT